MSLSDAEMKIALARRQVGSSDATISEAASAAFVDAVDDHFFFDMAPDWTGRADVLGCVLDISDGAKVTAAPPGAVPRFWTVVVGYEDGRQQSLKYFQTRDQADKLAERLKLIDAHAENDEFEKAAKLASIREDAVRHDPRSTAEDLAAAREARKDAEFNATRNDADLQRRISEREQVQRAAETERVELAARAYIHVPYLEKEQAKGMGAKWDRQEQSWYIPPGVDPAPLAKYAQEAPKSGRGAVNASATKEGDGASADVAERHYLAVPYADRHQARAAGAEWDKAAKCWYAGAGADMSMLAQWRPEKAPMMQDPAMPPREEFAEALRQAGCVVSGDHPLMDGQKHRITVMGEKHSENAGSGFYVGHLDGHPAGYIKNNKTGVETHWKSKGYALDAEQKAALQAAAATRLRERGAEQARLQEQAAERVVRQMVDLTPVIQPTPYMLAKGLRPQAGAMTDKVGKMTYLPATDVEGKQWTMQYIQEEGVKRFAKDSRKTGCFHAVGGLDALAKAPALVIAEGYATASSLAEALGHATVAAFDSGNLPHVALALHRKFPDKPVIIAGDNDQHLEETQGVNPGKKKAQEAARLSGGRVVLPIFAPGEQDGNPKGFTDFNDLANRSVLGREGLNRQIGTVVATEIAKREKNSLQLAHEQPLEHGLRRSIKLG